LITLLVSESSAKRHKASEPVEEISIPKKDELKVARKVEPEEKRMVPGEARTDTKKSIKIPHEDDKEKAADAKKLDCGYIEASVKERGELYIDGILCEVIEAQQKKTVTVDPGKHNVEMHYYKNDKKESYDVIIKEGGTENVYFTYDIMSDKIYLKDIRIDGKANVGKGVRFVAEFEGFYRFIYKKGSYDAWPSGAGYKKNGICIYKNRKITWEKGWKDRLFPSQFDFQIGKFGDHYDSFELAERDAVGDYFDVYLSKSDFLIFLIHDTITNDAGDVDFACFSDNSGYPHV
jgi:hypothetical protein